APVVATFRSMPDRSSTSTPRSLRRSSVCRGRISVIVPTLVDFHPPKPPAPKFFRAVAVSDPPKRRARSKPANSMQYIPVGTFVDRLVGGLRRGDAHVPLAPQVAEQYAGDVERQAEPGRDVGHGGRLAADVQNVVVLRVEYGRFL